jgi:prepilin-type N-terminal cleavage/methylation domain-containing protein
MKSLIEPEPQAPSAFTLIELLVVIALTGMLVVTVFAGTSGDTAKRLACADNLRRLASATQMFVGDNAGQFPYDGHTNPNFIGGAFRNTLMNSYRVKREDFYCPANASLNTDVNWFYVGGASGGNSNNPAVINYFYFPGFSSLNNNSQVASFYPANGSLPGGDNIRNHMPAFAMSETDAPYWKIMWSDANRKFASSFSSGANRSANHFGDKQPLGSNESYLDGHVEWVDFSKFSSGPKLSYSSSEYYFYGNPQQ